MYLQRTTVVVVDDETAAGGHQCGDDECLDAGHEQWRPFADFARRRRRRLRKS